jgi:hypothetical protein
VSERFVGSPSSKSALAGLRVQSAPRLDDLLHGVAELAREDAHAALAIEPERVAADGEVVHPDDVLVILEHADRAGAKHAGVAVENRQLVVDVRAEQHRFHARLHVVQPILHGRLLGELRIRHGESEPWARRIRDAGHHARAQHAGRLVAVESMIF